MSDALLTALKKNADGFVRTLFPEAQGDAFALDVETEKGPARVHTAGPDWGLVEMGEERRTLLDLARIAKPQFPEEDLEDWCWTQVDDDKPEAEEFVENRTSLVGHEAHEPEPTAQEMALAVVRPKLRRNGSASAPEMQRLLPQGARCGERRARFFPARAAANRGAV